MSWSFVTPQETRVKRSPLLDDWLAFLTPACQLAYKSLQNHTTYTLITPQINMSPATAQLLSDRLYRNANNLLAFPINQYFPLSKAYVTTRSSKHWISQNLDYVTIQFINLFRYAYFNY